MAGGRRGGRGGRGRGGRGRGRGRGRGGRGRGRGRGQQQRVVKRGPPNWFNALNVYNHRLILSFITKEEREVLGKAYPRFQPPKLTPQQQEAMEKRKKLMEEAVAKKKKQEEEKKEEEKKQETTKEEDVDEEKKADEAATSDKADTKESEETKDAKDTKDAANKDKLGNSPMSVSDPNTLLARLNTKRLYRRMCHARRNPTANGDENESSSLYPHKMNTAQIANQEWQGLMERYKQEQLKRLEEKKKKEAAEQKDENDENKEEETAEEEEVKATLETNGNEEVEEEKSTPDFPYPSSCELLLFSPCPRAVAVLASYPRSGNSLLRTLYERTTLRVTGSDMRGGLTQHDLVGEMAVQTNCVQFVKTHYPERMGTPPFQVSRAVLLVRNPYDAMESYFNLMMTNTHTTSLSDEQREKHKQVFESMCQKEILVWRDFNEFWLQQKLSLIHI